MAARGKPIPFSIREAIRSMRPSTPLRQVASALGVAIDTVRKYENKFSTKPLRSREKIS